MKTLLIFLISIASFNLFAEQGKVEERLDPVECKFSPQGNRGPKIVPAEEKKSVTNKDDKTTIAK